MDMEASAIIQALGEPLSVFAAASCVFEGQDKIYNYGSFELDTYELDGNDYVSCIYFRDDLVKTWEGISLFMSYEDMVGAYGEGYTEQSGAFIYEKDGMKLRFILKEGKITAIEYVSAVLDL